MHYDLVVIGSGPAGQKGAISAAKLGKRVALIEHRHENIGGVCLNTGTIPSKTLREAILHLTGFRQREVYGDLYARKRHITMNALRRKIMQVTERERDVIHEQLEQNDIDVFEGIGRFSAPDRIEVTAGRADTSVRGENILIACGTKPSRPDHIPFDGRTVFDSDEILALEQIPRSMIVVGGGVIGFEYAIMFAILGVKITVVDGRERLFEFCDREIVDYLMFHARALGISFRLGEQVTEIYRSANGAIVELESKKRLVAETALFSVGRVGATSELNAQEAGVEIDDRGRVRCDEDHRTSASHVYAVGDVIGFPALASTSMEQGRRAACKAFDVPFEPCSHIPYGLYTVPEVSMVGKNEQELTHDQIPYEVGSAHFSEIAKGQILGDHMGLLKLLFHRETHQLLGVHCIGEQATEIIHIGQAVVSLGGTVEYFCQTVFNYPTMAECYKVAAFDGLNRLREATDCEQSCVQLEHHGEEQPATEETGEGQEAETGEPLAV